MVWVPVSTYDITKFTLAVPIWLHTLKKTHFKLSLPFNLIEAHFTCILKQMGWNILNFQQVTHTHYVPRSIEEFHPLSFYTPYEEDKQSEHKTIFFLIFW